MISVEEKLLVNVLYKPESEILNGIEINVINFDNLIKLASRHLMLPALFFNINKKNLTYLFPKDFVEYISTGSNNLDRITMNLEILNNAKFRIIGIIGEQKIKIVKDLINRNINGEVMERMYARVLRDIKECRGFINANTTSSESVNNTQLAVLDVLEVFAYSILVDIFNDVPYSEALMGVDNLSPAYDDAATIYTSLASTLDGAITTLSGSSDMGDFAGGMIKYLNTHPVPYITIGGGIGKITKFAFGAVDLHSKRSQVNINSLADICKKADLPDVSYAKTALDALEIAGNGLAELIAKMAVVRLKELIKHPTTKCGIVIVNRSGKILAEEKK